MIKINSNPGSLETDYRNKEFATLISGVFNELREMKDKNERVIREIINETENKKTREEIKKQSERNIELAKIHFD